MTGKQSGEHGIFGFIDLEPGTHKMYFPNYLNVKASTMWDELAEYDKKTVVINNENMTINTISFLFFIYSSPISSFVFHFKVKK